MRYIILSDTHGSKKSIINLLNSVKHDGVIFAGDGVNDFDNIFNEDIIMVRGNCDFNSKIQNYLITEINNTKILLTHGNMFNVKNGLGALIEEAEKEKVNLVIFGHTHRKLLEKINNITYLNPGSFARTIFSKSSYAIIDFEENNFSIKVLEF